MKKNVPDPHPSHHLSEVWANQDTSNPIDNARDTDDNFTNLRVYISHNGISAEIIIHTIIHQFVEENIS